MKSLINNLPLGSKLVAICVASSLLALAIAGGFYLVRDYQQGNARFLSRIQLLSTIIAQNAESSLAFNDKVFGKKTLESIGAESSVVLGMLVDAEGKLLAHYSNGSEVPETPADFSLWDSKIDSDYLYVHRPIYSGDRYVGEILIKASRAQLKYRQWQNLLILVLVCMLAIALSSLLGRLLQKSISDSILRLASTAELIRQNWNWTQEPAVDTTRNDELGDLARAFDSMWKELWTHRHHLEDLVEERTAQLAEARRKAEEASQFKSTFLANMSHEIRTPMNAILGLTHLLKQSKTEPHQAEWLQSIDKSAELLLSIINDVLDLSRIESGKLELAKTEFRADEIFEHVTGMFGERLQKSGVDLTVAIDKSVPAVLKGDLTRLQQALLNYISNAVKFTQQGRIDLRIHRVYSNEGGLLLKFEVIDTGIGIEAEKLQKLFEAFSQGDTSTTRKYGGSGLGLVITRKLAQLMGGDAGGSSTPGIGSTFWFTARLEEGATDDVNESTENPKGSTPSTVLSAKERIVRDYSGSRILLVEDNAMNREVVLQLLSQFGLQIEVAENGRLAVQMVRNQDYDLVLMDVQMPEMDGLEATRHIREWEEENPSVQPLHILAMTANAFQDDQQACIDAGMNDFVSKPFKLADLMAKLLQWLPAKANC